MSDKKKGASLLSARPEKPRRPRSAPAPVVRLRHLQWPAGPSGFANFIKALHDVPEQELAALYLAFSGEPAPSSDEIRPRAVIHKLGIPVVGRHEWLRIAVSTAVAMLDSNVLYEDNRKNMEIRHRNRWRSLHSADGLVSPIKRRLAMTLDDIEKERARIEAGLKRRPGTQAHAPDTERRLTAQDVADIVYAHIPSGRVKERVDSHLRRAEHKRKETEMTNEDTQMAENQAEAPVKKVKKVKRTVEAEATVKKVKKAKRTAEAEAPVKKVKKVKKAGNSEGLAKARAVKAGKTERLNKDDRLVWTGKFDAAKLRGAGKFAGKYLINAGKDGLTRSQLRRKLEIVADKLEGRMDPSKLADMFFYYWARDGKARIVRSPQAGKGD